MVSKPKGHKAQGGTTPKGAQRPRGHNAQGANKKQTQNKDLDGSLQEPSKLINSLKFHSYKKIKQAYGHR